MTNVKYSIHPELLEDSFPKRACDHGDCDAEGVHRAPMNRSSLSTYYWFCLEHVREYNAKWNYYEGMDEGEVEVSNRFDHFWERPTWPFGVNPHDRQHFYAFHDPQDLLGFGKHFSAYDNDGYVQTEKYMTEEAEALRTLDLHYPLTSAKLKARYKELVKKYHPDRNGGCAISEEKLKHINKAYDLLKRIVTL
ncbi:MAG: DnaJ domain-containing protein [Caedimonadaceae bacterium]|nr:MAG: DnaJ domain-containing protein [Caedimonadaceae bacterium]